MGTQINSYAGIGVLVDNPHVTIRERSCSHVIPERAKYCPACGKEAITEYTKLHEALTDIPENFKHIISTDEQEHFVFIVSIDTDWEFGSNGISINLEEITALKAKLKEYLDPHGLWDEEEFRLWVVNYVSY